MFNANVTNFFFQDSFNRRSRPNGGFTNVQNWNIWENVESFRIEKNVKIIHGDLQFSIHECLMNESWANHCERHWMCRGEYNCLFLSSGFRSLKFDKENIFKIKIGAKLNKIFIRYSPKNSTSILKVWRKPCVV